MTQIVENWARIAGRVEAWEAPESGGMGTLTLRVETVSDIPRQGEKGTYKNLLKGTEGQSLRIQMPAAGSRGIPPVGERLELDVRRGRSPDHVFARPSPFPP